MKADALALLERLRTIYGLPNGVDDDAVPKFFAEYVRALEGFDAKVMRKTGDHLLRTSKFWPRPSEIVDVAEGYIPYIPPASSGDSAVHRAIQSQRDMIAAATREYMTSCPSSLIDMALKQGWSRSLEDVARDVIRRCYERDGKLPTQAMMTNFRMPQADVDDYARNGQSHLQMDVDMLLAARAQTGATDGVLSDVTKRMTGEHRE